MESAGQKAGQPRMRGVARLDELIGLVLTLEERDQLDPREQRRLDRTIGAESERLSGLPRLRHWLSEAPSENLASRLRRVRSALAGLCILLGAMGFFAGWAAAAALLSIEVHTGRINIVLAWGLLVAAPFLSWFLSLIAWAGTKIFALGGDNPSLGVLVRRISIGRLALRLLPASVREDIEVVMGRMTAHGRLYGRVEKGQLFHWSHVLGLGFSLGAVVSTLAFVVFTDLAFGWSTTLDATAKVVHAGAQWLAAPWAWLWPSASPSLELVESTRYFRVASPEHIHVVDPIVYGGWWPFLVMSILVYAILPRLLIGGLLVWGQSREIGRAMGQTLGVERLIERLDQPLVEGQALEEEGDFGVAFADLTPEVEIRAWVLDQTQRSAGVVAIRWAEMLEDDSLLAALGADSLEIIDVGGRRSLTEDAEAIERAGGAAAVLCVRGYEPPVLDLLDFLEQWRQRVGAAPKLAVALLDASPADQDTWRRKLIGLGDPGLVVGQLERNDV